ncbi:MAG: hypothetical protein J5608_00825 [Alphaproteobacteria bacterium]|nr:hypothetical protein [Alphaproteobacteria bacterium]
MTDKWKIIEKDERAMTKQEICFYCKRFFCTGYIHPRCRMVCSGILPQWEWLYFLMRNVRATDTCKKFTMHKLYQERENKR